MSEFRLPEPQRLTPVGLQPRRKADDSPNVTLDVTTEPVDERDVGDDATGEGLHRRRRRRLGEVLVESGVITPAQLREVLAAQADQPAGHRRRLGALILERGWITENDIAAGLASALNLPLVDLAEVAVSPTAARIIPRGVSERYGVLGVDLSNGRLTLAMSDPTDVVALDDIRLYTRVRDVHVVVAVESAIREYLARVWSLIDEGSVDFDGMFDDDSAQRTPDEDEFSDANSTPVVRLLNSILSDAITARASDIHLQPELDGLRVRYRVDGLLRDVMTVPRAAAPSMTSRMKIVSGLDIAEHRRPQDGRTKLNVAGEVMDARVSTLPSMHGEKVVVRLLSRREGVIPLNRVGFEDRALEHVLDTIVAPQGLVLITGPTGSGKTSTLYSAVAQMRTPDRNIVTLEDPVEIQLRGITQVQTNERAGLTFATGLRSVLRQDPDVVLVGEIRDSETAELALRASLTGHLVFSTLHTIDASAAVTRLVDMGVEPYLIASSLSLVVAQRLVRVPCESCSARYMPSPRTLQLLGVREDDLETAEPRRGKGCERCGASGYKGRRAIFEVLPVDTHVRAVLTANATENGIRSAARLAGVLSLRADGVAKAMRGETTFEEVLRVTQVDGSGGLRCPACHRAVEEGMAFCPWCATPYSRSACQSCGGRLEPEWRHCPWCRAEHVTGLVLPAVEVESDAELTPTRVRRLLVVDDDPTTRAFIHVVMGDSVEVIATTTAEDALRLAATEDLDAMVLDFDLPDLSGVEVMRLLRADTRTALLPLLLLTGSKDAKVQAEALHAGANDYLTKPVEPSLLSDRLNQLLELSVIESE